MAKNDDDCDDKRRQVALFRHAVIAELDFEELPPGVLSARIRELAERTFKLESRKERRFTERTLWKWWSAYKRGGLTALMPKARKDRGLPRVLDPELLAKAIACRNDVPARSTATVIDVLEKQGVVAPGKLHRSTLDKHLELAGASRRRMKTLGTKRFIRLQMERPNQLWLGDYHEAPILWDPVNQHWRTVHFGGFIDHYSKVVPHGQWYRNEQIATLEDSFKKALLKRGAPERVYVDLARIYRSEDFLFALDHVGVKKVHSRPYAKEARGGIERFNRTIVEQFEPEARAVRIDDIDQLNAVFEAWLEQRYHLTRHEGTGEIPLYRFDQPGFVPRFLDPTLVADTFRVRVKRKVHPKTSTVEVDGVSFLVETFLRGRWVRVYYDPHRLDDVLVVLNRKPVQRAFPAKPNEPPQPTPERPQPSPPSFDYLGALRAEYDRRIIAEARTIRLSDFQPDAGFTLPAFLDVCSTVLGKDLSPYERDELTRTFHGIGPFCEKTVRVALEHAIRLRGRGLHVSVYTHYLKVFHLRDLHSDNKELRP